MSGMHRGEEVQFGSIHSPELPHERVLPQLFLRQQPLLQSLLPIPKPPGLPQVHQEPIHLLWEKVLLTLSQLLLQVWQEEPAWQKLSIPPQPQLLPL